MTQRDSLRGIVGRILLNDWDPIGVRDVAQAQDEYDQYVVPVAQRAHQAVARVQHGFRVHQR